VHAVSELVTYGGVMSKLPYWDETIRYVYCLNSALLSIISTRPEGSTVEIGLVGNEGIVGCLRFWAACRRTARSYKSKEMHFGLEGSESTMNSGGMLISAIYCWNNQCVSDSSRAIDPLQLLSHAAGAPVEVAADGLRCCPIRCSSAHP